MRGCYTAPPRAPGRWRACRPQWRAYSGRLGGGGQAGGVVAGARVGGGPARSSRARMCTRAPLKKALPSSFRLSAPSAPDSGAAAMRPRRGCLCSCAPCSVLHESIGHLVATRIFQFLIVACCYRDHLSRTSAPLLPPWVRPPSLWPRPPLPPLPLPLAPRPCGACLPELRPAPTVPPPRRPPTASTPPPPTTTPASRINKKRKFVADGVLFAEVNELFSHELIDAGYAGVEIRNAPMRTEIIVRASRPQGAWPSAGGGAAVGGVGNAGCPPLPSHARACSPCARHAPGDASWPHTSTNFHAPSRPRRCAGR